MNRVIALDIGGVCIKLTPEKTFAFLGVTGIDQVPKEFLAACDMIEKGKISESDWLTVFHGVSSEKHSDAELIDAWNMIIGDDMDGMPELAAELVDAGFQLVFFSDIAMPHVCEVRRKLSFAHLVTGAVFSFEEGAKKPEDQMYQAFEKKYGRPCFYTDDRQNNIDGGIRNGWKSHTFTSTVALREAFLREYPNALS